MREQEINKDNPKKYTFEKRTQEQRDLDRDFIADYIAHSPNETSVDIYTRLLQYIQSRGDEYTLEYQYVCREISKIKKDAIKQSSKIDLGGEISRSLELINENISLCVNEIRVRMTAREDVTTHIYDITAKDMHGLTLEQIHAINMLQEKIKKRYVSVRKIRPGADVKEMMEALHMWIKRKCELLGEDAPKKIAQKIDLDIEVQQMSLELLETEITSMGFDAKPLVETLKQTLHLNGSN